MLFGSSEEDMVVMIMTDDRPLFILAGNGPYDNRGCEAIVRGTTKILRAHFKDPRFICLSHFQNEGQYQKQKAQEYNEDIEHLHSNLMSKKKIIRNFWKPSCLGYLYDYFLRPERAKYRIYEQILPHLDYAAAVLSVGGDNYSLDYGMPRLFTDLDDVVIEKGKPLVLWGASVGPFSAMPDYERFMAEHLKKTTGIFARESATINYLNIIGVKENIHAVADPAFVMDAVKPEGIGDKIPIGEEMIGINLSPLMAKYVTGGNLEKWSLIAARIISHVAKATDRHICLIPHVTSPQSNDHAFMQKAIARINDSKRNITLIPPKYNAEETKWIISRMTVFAGARTHSTIAALSSGVPTLSFAYSIKAQGINRDIFNHTDFCVEPTKLNQEAVSSRIISMLEDNTVLRKHLIKNLSKVQGATMGAGMELKHLIGEA
jgi:polysaccharide pyruvyl transferase WcaK-like protein